MKQMLVLIMLVFLAVGISNAYAGDSDNYCTVRKSYRTYDDIKARLSSLALASPGYTEFKSVGTTTLGTPIQALIITSQAVSTNTATVLITGGIHAREWIGVEVAVGLAEYLISKKTDTTPVFDAKKQNMNIKKMLENVKVVIIPVLNPDGYVFSTMVLDNACLSSSPTKTSKCYYTDPYTKEDELYSEWRKNLRQFVNSIGVDLNRNFEKFFYDNKSVERDETYGGPSPFSEQETQAVKKLFEEHTFNAVIDFHSNARYVLHPWGGTAEPISDDLDNLRPHGNTKDRELFNLIGTKIAENIKPSATEVLPYYGDNPNPGVARDWEYYMYNAAAFNIELNENNQPQPSEISQICEDNIKGPIWLMFWAADQGFRSRPKLHLGEPTDVLVK